MFCRVCRGMASWPRPIREYHQPEQREEQERVEQQVRYHGVFPLGSMESTGEYWKPVCNLLEGTGQVFLVHASHVKRVPGRKTDTADARWLAQLMRHGLLQASCIPPAGQRDV